jgi:hypothetical protein
MSEAFTDTTDRAAAEAAAPGAGTAGRHRGTVALDDGGAPRPTEVGHGRHRRSAEPASAEA